MREMSFMLQHLAPVSAGSAAAVPASHLIERKRRLEDACGQVGGVDPQR
jgi:hypothetical protein